MSSIQNSTEMLPEISVIILCYNHAESIRRAVLSVVNQKFDHGLEIILSDDCSSDATPEICRALADEYPDIIRLAPSVKRRGVVKNYFDAFAMCRGRFITDCAGDDFWASDNTATRLYEAIASDDGVSIAFGNWMTVDPTGNHINMKPSGYQKVKAICSGESGTTDNNFATIPGRLLLEPVLLNLGDTLIHLSAAIYHKSIISNLLSTNPEVVYNPDSMIEDLPILMALLNAGNAKCITDPQPLLAYTVGGDSVSSPANNTRAAKFYIQAATLYKRLYKIYITPTPSSETALHRILKDKLRYALIKASAGTDRKTIRDVRQQLRANGISIPFMLRIRILIRRLISRQD